MGVSKGAWLGNAVGAFDGMGLGAIVSATSEGVVLGSGEMGHGDGTIEGLVAGVTDGIADGA